LSRSCRRWGCASLHSNNLHKKAFEQKANDFDALKAQYDSTAINLTTAQNALTESKGKLWDALKLWNAAQTSAKNYMGENRRLTSDMKAIVETLAPTFGTLQSVQGSLAGLACGGGANDEPTNGGAEYRTRIPDSIAQISAASRIAQRYVP
jgi:hypothetical protein